MRLRLPLAVSATLLLVAAATTWWVLARDGAPVERDRCGPKPERAGGGTWECTFVDDFSGSGLDRERWVPHQLVGSGNLCVLDDPRAVAVADGRLRLSVLPADPADPCPLRKDGTRAAYVAGWVTTHDLWSQQYGRFEARIRTDETDGPGLQEGFWLWPDVRHGAADDWPATGEIDIMETYSDRPDLMVPFLHYSADSRGPVDGLNTAWDCASSRGEWHTYTLEWTADQVEIFVDGESCLVNTDGASSFRKPFIINLSQLLGSGRNAPTAGTALPAGMDVDYVKVWR
jgi:beta-glucanase (GH16 family)